MNKHEEYYRQVQLMLRILPLIYRIDDFAVHGGTAINLFHRNMPRYSVDIDLTYIPVAGRAESLSATTARCESAGCFGKLVCRNDGYTIYIRAI